MSEAGISAPAPGKAARPAQPACSLAALQRRLEAEQELELAQELEAFQERRRTARIARLLRARQRSASAPRRLPTAAARRTYRLNHPCMEPRRCASQSHAGD